MRAIEPDCNPGELEAMVTLLAVHAGFQKASAHLAVVREEPARMEAL